MNRLSDWLGSEAGHFWLITATLCIIFCFGGYFGGRVWVNRYLATHATKTADLDESTLTPKTGQPGQGISDERPRWSQSPTVVIRQRQPSDLERQQLTAPSNEPQPGLPGMDGQPGADQGTMPGTSTSGPPETQPAPPPPPDSSVAPPPKAGIGTDTTSGGGSWSVTAGSYRDRRNAQQVAESLGSMGLHINVERVIAGGKMSYRVNAGTFTSKADAEATGEVIQAAGYPSKVERAK